MQAARPHPASRLRRPRRHEVASFCNDWPVSRNQISVIGSLTRCIDAKVETPYTRPRSRCSRPALTGLQFNGKQGAGRRNPYRGRPTCAAPATVSDRERPPRAARRAGQTPLNLNRHDLIGKAASLMSSARIPACRTRVCRAEGGMPHRHMARGGTGLAVLFHPCSCVPRYPGRPPR